MRRFWKILRKRSYELLAFTGLWTVPILIGILKIWFPEQGPKNMVVFFMALTGWITCNNFWSVACEGKRLKDIHMGDGLIPETGLKKESPQKRVAMYPKVPEKLLSREPEGIVLGRWRNRYVRMHLNDILHCCIIGGSGSGKTSTVIMDTLLANLTSGKQEMTCFAIDIKGELHQKATMPYDPNIYVVDPSDRSSYGWDVYYRLQDDPGDDLIMETLEGIAQALIVSSNAKDMFFVENGRTIFVGLLAYYFKQGENFIDSVSKILEADIRSLITEIIKMSDPSDLWYKHLAKFSGKDAESVQDCIVEMTTSLSVFSKSDVRFCFRDNIQKTSPADFKEGRSIFLAIPEHLLESYRAVMRLCTTQTLKELERRPEERNQRPMLVLIDEFARIGRMDGIFNALATLRSKSVMVMLAFQSLAQCEVIYSREETRVLTDNCRIKVICEVSDPDSTRTIQEWCGRYREKKETLSGGKNRHKSYTYEDKLILEQSDLITLVKKEEEILIISGIGYLRPEKCYYFKDKILSSMADKVMDDNQRGIKNEYK